MKSLQLSFDVRSYYSLLSGSLNCWVSLVFAWESIWYVKVPKRVSFLWTAAWDGILTIDNLVKWGQSLVNRCCMCRCDGKSMDHLLLHVCSNSMEWNFFGAWNPVSDARDCHFSPFCMAELDGKEPVTDLEYGSRISDVVNLAGKHYPYLWR